MKKLLLILLCLPLLFSCGEKDIKKEGSPQVNIPDEDIFTTLNEPFDSLSVTVPKATEIKKITKKSLINYIYIGNPKKKEKGEIPFIQLNDTFKEANIPKMTTPIKADESVTMGIISDIKQQKK